MAFKGIEPSNLYRVTGETQPDFAPIFPFDTNPLDMQLIQSYACQGIIFCLSSVTVDVLRKIKSTLITSKASEAIVVITISPDAFKALISSFQLQLQFLSPPLRNDTSDDNSYKWLQSFLEPAAVTIVYYPVHCFPILAPSTHAINETSTAINIQCEVYNLSSITCRNTTPLSLHNIGMWNVNNHIQTIRDVLAGDVPPQHSSKLKSFAHELAGSLIFDLGLDPTSSISALGKSSSLIGYCMYIDIYVYICLFVCMYVCMCMYIYKYNMIIYILMNRYMYIYTYI
jgi:hypothetical protein